jgi:hypothetical protein
MNTQAILDFLELRGVYPATDLHHEHTAVRHADVAGAAALYGQMGYSVTLRDDRRVAFAQKAAHRVEIIHPDVAEPHEAFAVREAAEWELVRDAVRQAASGFEVLIEDESKPGFRNLLFRHSTTGACLQVVWREEQVFAGVFPG